jgi:iron-sulfur cluster assembly accessory protein
MNLEITDKAKSEIQNLLKNESSKSFFRITIEGGGCSGFKYKFSVDDNINDDDQKFGDVIIDETSLSLIDGSKVDFIDTLIEKSFKILNPKATSSCGCGTSFSI